MSVVNDTADKVVAWVPLGSLGGISGFSHTEGMAYDNQKGVVFVTNNDGNVSVINDTTDKVVDAVPVGLGLDAIAYDSTSKEALVANADSSNVSVISASIDKVVGAVNVGSFPCGIAYDSGNGHIYVSNVDQGTISIVSAIGGYPVTFTESGLPPGTTWSVALNGDVLSSSASTMTFVEPNGTYAYTVGSLTGYAMSPSVGQVIVNGANQEVSVTFSTGFLGLPDFEGYILLGVIVAAVAAGVAILLMRKRTPPKPASASPKKPEQEKAPGKGSSPEKKE